MESVDPGISNGGCLGVSISAGNCVCEDVDCKIEADKGCGNGTCDVSGGGTGSNDTFPVEIIIC